MYDSLTYLFKEYNSSSLIYDAFRCCSIFVHRSKKVRWLAVSFRFFQKKQNNLMSTFGANELYSTATSEASASYELDFTPITSTIEAQMLFQNTIKMKVLSDVKNVYSFHSNRP